MDGITYIATPYTGQETESFEDVTRYSGLLMQKGEVVYSPITHSHPIAEMSDLPGGWDYWEVVDRHFIKSCVKLIVYMREGWKESVGVTAEIKMAEEFRIPVEYHEAIQWP